MSLATLATYGITPERGFLCAFDAASVALGGELGEVRELALRLPEILPTGAVRDVLGKLMTMYQPMKMAAAEALYHTAQPAPFSANADRSVTLLVKCVQPGHRPSGPTSMN